MSKIIGTFLYIYNPIYPQTMSNLLFEHLAGGHYIVYFDGKLVVTNKFLREFAKPLELKKDEPKVEVLNIPKNNPARPVMPNLPTKLVEPAPSPFMQFIRDCRVPEKIPTKDGAYWANRFSKPAEKEFIKILKQGYNYEVLVAATTLYYKSGGMPQAISNYILNGTWMGCYEDLKHSVVSGTVKEYVEKNTNKGDEEGKTRYER